MRSTFVTLLALLWVVGCASNRAPGDPNTKTTHRLETQAKARREAKQRKIERDFAEIEKALQRLRVRELARAERRRHARDLARLEARIRQARQDIRDLKVVSDDSFERLEARLDVELPLLRESYGKF